MEWINGETVALALFFIGLAGLILRRNMIISIISIGIMDSAIILFFITMNATMSGIAPMVPMTYEEGRGMVYVMMDQYVDPVPHALMITSIVIGIAVMAVSLILVINMYREYQTLDWKEARDIREAQSVGGKF